MKDPFIGSFFYTYGLFQQVLNNTPNALQLKNALHQSYNVILLTRSRTGILV